MANNLRSEQKKKTYLVRDRHQFVKYEIIFNKFHGNSVYCTMEIVIFA